MHHLFLVHIVFKYTYNTSNLSRFMTLVQAATKSVTNLSLPSSAAYTSAIALSSVFDPKIKSALVPLYLITPVLLSEPSNKVSSSEVAFQVLLKSKIFTKKSLVSVPTVSVNTPYFEAS